MSDEEQSAIMQTLERATREKLSLKGLKGEIEELVKKVDEMIDRLSKLELHVDGIQTLPRVQAPEIKPVETTATNSVIIEEVQKFLGEGFEVKLEPAEVGVSFRLTIIPPQHLRESDNDIRVSVISNIDGINGAMSYAERVKNFCVRWAQKNGVAYSA